MEIEKERKNIKLVVKGEVMSWMLEEEDMFMKWLERGMWV